MNIVKFLLARLLLAVSLCAGAGQAAAGPIYQVSIDTASLGTGQAFLGLYFLGLGSAAPATATVTNLLGALSGTATPTGDVTGSAPGPIVFGNGGDFVQGVALGGTIGFDVALDFDPGTDGLVFGWSLFDASQYLGADGDLGRLLIQPGEAGQQVVVAQLAAIGTVNAVPEPSSVALMMAGLAGLSGLSFLAARRRTAVD